MRPSHGSIAGVSAQSPSNRRQIDDIDLRLLAELQEDARVSNAELGRRVGLSAPAVAERVARLQESGAITGFHAAVDPRALGLTLSAILRIRPAPRELPKVAQLARDTPEVVECHRITGDDCFFLKLHVRDVEHLEEVIDAFAFYGQTTTSIMQTSPVPRRAVSPHVSESSSSSPPGHVALIRQQPAGRSTPDGPGPLSTTRVTVRPPPLGDQAQRPGAGVRRATQRILFERSGRGGAVSGSPNRIAASSPR